MSNAQLNEVTNPCRDDRCSRLWVHPEHEIRDSWSRGTIRVGLWGWRRDPLEMPKRRKRGSTTPRMAWQKHAYWCLEEIILSTVSQSTIRPFSMIYDNVINDYGSITDRTVYRYIKHLIGAGKLVRVQFDRRISGYLKTPTKLLADRESLREQLVDSIMTYSA